MSCIDTECRKTSAELVIPYGKKKNKHFWDDIRGSCQYVNWQDNLLGTNLSETPHFYITKPMHRYVCEAFYASPNQVSYP